MGMLDFVLYECIEATDANDTLEFRSTNTRDAIKCSVFIRMELGTSGATDDGWHLTNAELVHIQTDATLQIATKKNQLDRKINRKSL